jgi:hypothetical protein
MLIYLPLIIIFSVFALKFWAQVGCTEYTDVIVENFDTDLYKNTEMSSVAYWPPGPITLNWLGGNLDMQKPWGMGARIYVAAPGDFDNDGYPDLIGFLMGDMTDDYSGALVLIRNKFNDANLDGVDDDGLIFDIDPFEIYDWGLLRLGPASITTGDYNGDGLIDFFFLNNARDKAIYDRFSAVMYINCGTAENPHFRRSFEAPNLDFTARFMDTPIYLRWCADHLCSVDIDKDGDTDILDVSQNEIYLVRNPGSSDFDLDHFTITELNYDQRPGFPLGEWIGGGSSINAADFDLDGDLDIVASSVEPTVPYIVFYENDGTGFFKRYEIPIGDPNCIGTVALMVDDFDQDGLIDIMGSNDKAVSHNDSRLYIWRNKGVVEGGGLPIDFEWKCLLDCEPILPPLNDCDMGRSLDFDLDGDIDIIMADANGAGDYYLGINNLANVYTTYGEAQSLNLIPLLDSFQYAVTKVDITGINMGTRGSDKTGLKVEFYLSNNGEDWELFQTWEANDIHNYNSLPTYTFKHFGSQLLWKVVFSAPEDPMMDYTGASFDTPWIGEIEFECIHVDRREYSRTSVAATVTDEEAQKKNLIIGSTFYYPSWQGHLRAYDVSSVTPQDTAYSVLRTITRPNASEPQGREIVQEGVEILWDSGVLLYNRDASTRNIYTAIPSGDAFDRVDFTDAYVGVLGPILQDVNNDNEGLINFIRGEGREWKLGDSNHSNPIVVGPPIEAPVKMGDGYQQFMTDWADRKKVLYIGSNDGMLHCIDVLTGTELWGFIPYNQLPRLRDMWEVFPATGQRYYEHHIYLDGSPAVADVFIDADGDSNEEWRTVLICGQGPGNGSALAGGLNYYFALDITNPEDPQPLWEFTHAQMGETWSVPAIGRVKVKNADTWVAFMGSGYDNNAAEIVGNRFYVVNVETGEEEWGFDVPEVDTTHTLHWNIPNTLPASPATVDMDQDGFTDRVYIADLDGRIWKVDVTPNLVNAGSWSEELIYEDSNNFPIVCKPAIWLNPVSGEIVPRLYFGTGGDDRAPGDVNYSFIALIDLAVPEVEWYLGDPAVVGLPMEKDMGDLAIGDKVWADPKVADFIVYFSTLVGSIDSVDPCESLAGVGKLYARYIQAEAGSLIGGTALKTFTGPVENLELSIKTRAAVTLGERQRTSDGTRKREVYIQEYDSTIQKLEQFAVALLKIRSWREIFKIIR